MTIAQMIAQNNVFLAPMAGVTDMPFRLLCKEQGCGLTYTEMVSAKGLHYSGGSARTDSILQMGEAEVPCAVQIFGSDPDIMAEQAARIYGQAGEAVALFDINMGCPANKIVSNGEGSALMKNLPLAALIIQAVKRAVPVDVTVKFRKGWDDEQVNAVEFARMAEQSGASAVTVHGRTRQQHYSGKADWDIIRAVVQAVSIPVLGNGDIFCAQDAKDMLTHTGCNGVMVARGAQGNPFIFKQIAHLLKKNESIPLPAPHERIDMALRHAAQLVQCKGERAIIEMRKHIAWYISNMPGAAKIRESVNRCSDLDALTTLLRDFEASLQQEPAKDFCKRS